ncbi:MAG: hypothetical protein HYY18_11305 [Planctomycetes bacterium]|nr:hypothetical protein [Planctomycetota bacterium]
MRFAYHLIFEPSQLRMSVMRKALLAAMALGAASCTTAYSYRKNTVVVRNESGGPIFDVAIEIRGDRHSLGALHPGDDRHVTVRPALGGRVTLTWRTAAGATATWEGGELEDYVYHVEYRIRQERVEEEIRMRTWSD